MTESGLFGSFSRASPCIAICGPCRVIRITISQCCLTAAIGLADIFLGDPEDLRKPNPGNTTV